MVTYCEVTDLLVGKIPLPAYLDPGKFVQDATDEIDTKIGRLYKTPVDIAAVGLAREAKLVLKRINAHLATGRLLLSVAAPEEQRQLHAYAWSLVKEALAALECIANGEYPLEGAEPAEGAETVQKNMALISNLDPESQVEAFYDRIANPNYWFPEPVRTYRGRG